jgi:hypothetical protein
MASIINVDQIDEATSGSGVHIPGHSIQTVSGTYSTAGSTTSTSAVQAWTGLSITPKFSNSLIKVECNWFCMHRDYYDGYAQIYRNGSATNVRKVIRNTGHTGASFVGQEARYVWYCPAWLWSFTEAAGGTSQLTYSIYCWTQNAGQTTWWNDAYSSTEENPTSTLILTEIAQ